jgi:hypothetical protein
LKGVLTVLEGVSSKTVLESLGLTDLDLRMVWCYPESDETEWHRQLLIHVDLGTFDVPHHLLCSIEAGWAGADDGYRRRRSVMVSRRSRMVRAPGDNCGERRRIDELRDTGWRCSGGNVYPQADSVQHGGTLLAPAIVSLQGSYYQRKDGEGSMSGNIGRVIRSSASGIKKAQGPQSTGIDMTRAITTTP